MIGTRRIHLKSDDGRYEIIAKLVSEQDSYSQDNWLTYKTYTGSHWTVTMKQDGRRVDWIISADRRLYIHFGEYGTGLCPYGMKLNKNVIIYGALCTERFGKELAGYDIKKYEKLWMKAYVDARINKELNNLNTEDYDKQEY